MGDLIFGTERKEKKKSKWFYLNVTLLLLKAICEHFSLPMPGHDVTQLQPSTRKVNSITEPLLH